MPWQMIAGTLAKMGGDALKAYGATLAADDEYAAWLDAKKYADEDRNRIIDLYRESRGSNGSALLPTYFGEGDSSFEKQMANDLMGGYNAASDYYGDGASRLRKFQGAVDEYSAARRGATDTVNNLFSGRLADQAVEDMQPALEARTAAAKTSRSTYMQALAERLNQIGAGNRARGYSGGGGLAERQLLGATWDANNAGALAEANATYQNAAQVAATREAYRQSRLANANLPYSMSMQNGQMVAMPVSLANQSYSDQQAPLNFFKIGNNVPYGTIASIRTPPPPTLPSNMTVWANAVGEGMSSWGQGMTGGGGGGGGGNNGGGNNGGGGGGGQFMNFSNFGGGGGAQNNITPGQAGASGSWSGAGSTGWQ